MGVLLGRRKTLVPQQLLDGTQISSGTEHVGGKGVPERMRMHFQFLSEPAHMMINNVSDAAPGQSPPSVAQEQRVCRRLSLSCCRRLRPLEAVVSHSQIILQSFR